MKPRPQPRSAHQTGAPISDVSDASAPAPHTRAESGVRERLARTNLAHGRTRFVGRRREMSELRTCITEARVVSVVGAAGVGKTRLACETARALLDEYVREGGAWCVDLASAGDADGAIAAVARTLWIPATATGADAGAAMGGALAERGKTLVVLDAVDACAPSLVRLLGDWTRVAPDVRWIATSRVPPGLDAERVIDLRPLATGAALGSPDAVWLYFDRARATTAVQPGFTVDARTEDDVLDRVRKLEGMPLRIEIDAASGDRRSAIGPTLHADIDASCGRLDPRTRSTLARVSRFVAPFDLAAAEALTGSPCAREIETLRDKALVSATVSLDGASAPRFTMPAAVRERVRAMLVDDGLREVIDVRHARHCVAAGLALAERWESDASHDTLSAIARIADDLLAAHRRMLPCAHDGAVLAVGAALALDPLLAAVGPASLRLSLLGSALDAAERGDIGPVLRMRALRARSEAHRTCSRIADAIADANAAVAISTSCGAHDETARALMQLGVLAVIQQRYADARGSFDRAMSLAVESHARREEGRVLGCVASLDALEGRLERAWASLERAIAIHRDTHDVRFEALSCGNLAVVAHDMGKLDDARLWCDRALSACRTACDRKIEGEVLGLLAVIAHEQDRGEAALDSYARALVAHREAGHRLGEGTLLAYQGALLAEYDDVQGARAAYGRALSLLRELRDRTGEALVLGAMAALEARGGSLASARAAMAHATECLHGHDEPRSRAALELWRGHLEIALAREARVEGDDARAAMLLGAARRRLEEASPDAAGKARRAVDVRLAMRALRHALDSAERGDPPEAALSSVPSGPPPAAPADALVVCAHGRWFRVPRGQVVSVARWRPLQRLLERLAERREIAPGEPLSVDALVAAGWPGERMIAKAGATRVYTAIASLRRLGLRELLVRESRGYRLREDVAVVRVSR